MLRDWRTDMSALTAPSLRLSIRTHVVFMVLAIGASVTVAQDAKPQVPVIAEHAAANPVYQNLITGTSDDLSAFDHQVEVVKPLMKDNMSQAEQREVLKQVGGKKYSVEDLLNGSISAPHVLEMDREAIDDSAKSTMLTTLSLYFVAKGDLEMVADPKFLESLMSIDGRSDEKADPLTDEQLQAAKIDPTKIAKDQEGMSVVEGTIFDRIHVTGVARSYWTRSGDSIVSAALFDRRFADKGKLAPTWERFERQEDGSMKSAETGKLPGLGAYVKITPIKGADKLLFIEAHGALLEPYSWFQGANLLGSKLPTALRNQVQDIRRRAIRASR